MKFRKFLTYFLSFSLLLSFTACNSRTSDVSMTSEETSEETTERFNSSVVFIQENTIPEPYMEVIDSIKYAIRSNGDFDYESLNIPFTIEDIIKNRGRDSALNDIYFALADLTNDGIDELILCTLPNENSNSYEIQAGWSVFSVYTLQDDSAFLLTSLSENHAVINDSGYLIYFDESEDGLPSLYVSSFDVTSNYNGYTTIYAWPDDDGTITFYAYTMNDLDPFSIGSSDGDMDIIYDYADELCESYYPLVLININAPEV